MAPFSSSPLIRPSARRIFLFIVINMVIILLATPSVHATTVQLSWDKVSHSELAGYKVYYGLQDTDITSEVDIRIDDPDQTSCSIENLEEGKTYAFTMKSFTSSGMESDFSDYLYYGVPTSTTDSDGDGLTDTEETDTYGTDPEVADTDGDGLSDGEEVDYWGADWNTDIDKDAVINLLDNDSDGDGFDDGEELADNTDPSDPQSYDTISNDEYQIVDNESSNCTYVGTWPTSTWTEGYYASNYQHASAGDGSMKATWSFDVNYDGKYELLAQWASASGRATDAPYAIYNNGELVDVVNVDQTTNGGQFNTLGTFSLESGKVEVILSDNASGYVIADAVKLSN